MNRKRMGVKLFSLFSFLTFASGAVGQSLQDSEHANNAWLLGRKHNPWTNPGSGQYAPSSPGDSELGEQRILPKRQEYKPFYFQLTQRAMWTDNAALSDRDELSDFYSNTDLYLGFMPQIGPSTTAQISASYSFFRYLDHNSLNFDSFEAALGINHVFTELNNLSLWARYSNTRLLSAVNHNELFTNHGVELGAFFPIQLGINKTAYGAVSSKFSLDSNPGSAQRNEHSVRVGYKFSPIDRLQLEGFYRIAMLDYREGGREDLLQMVALTASTKVTDNTNLVLSASYSMNDSNLPNRDYAASGIGAFLSLSTKF